MPSRYQIRLATMLLVLTIASVGFALLGWAFNENRAILKERERLTLTVFQGSGK